MTGRTTGRSGRLSMTATGSRTCQNPSARPNEHVARSRKTRANTSCSGLSLVSSSAASTLRGSFILRRYHSSARTAVLASPQKRLEMQP